MTTKTPIARRDLPSIRVHGELAALRESYLAAVRMRAFGHAAAVAEQIAETFERTDWPESGTWRTRAQACRQEQERRNP